MRRRTRSTAAGTSSGAWRRSSARSRWGWNDCAPTLTRVTPWSARTATRSASSVSGLASTENSWPPSGGSQRSTAVSRRPSCAGLRCVGVPPPRKRVRTGCGAPGVGRATGWALAGAGADVALNYYSMPESAEELAGRVRALGRKALLFPVDVADQAAVEGMVGRVAAELGRLDVFVSCAYFSEREF